MKLLLGLYPKAWRARYEEEVARMLDDSGSGLRDAPDLLRGALDARAHPGPLGLPSGGIRGWFSLPRNAGLTAIVAGVVWLLPQLALPVLAVSHYQRADLMIPVAFMAVPGLFGALAMAGLLARHVPHRHDRTIAAAALALVGAGSGGMIGVLLVNAAVPGVPLVPFESEGFMTAGTAASALRRALRPSHGRLDHDFRPWGAHGRPHGHAAARWHRAGRGGPKRRRWGARFGGVVRPRNRAVARDRLAFETSGRSVGWLSVRQKCSQAGPRFSALSRLSRSASQVS